MTFSRAVKILQQMMKLVNKAKTIAPGQGAVTPCHGATGLAIDYNFTGVGCFQKPRDVQHR